MRWRRSTVLCGAMGIQAQVLGEAERDNAAFVRVDSGQAVARLLLDRGSGCPDALGIAEIQAVDHLLFSHLHMDHVAGFDSFIRRTYDRTAPPNHVWRPPGTARILQHRFQGYFWKRRCVPCSPTRTSRSIGGRPPVRRAPGDPAAGSPRR